jgi:hypothetical protein
LVSKLIAFFTISSIYKSPSKYNWITDIGFPELS